MPRPRLPNYVSVLEAWPGGEMPGACRPPRLPVRNIRWNLQHRGSRLIRLRARAPCTSTSYNEGRGSCQEQKGANIRGLTGKHRKPDTRGTQGRQEGLGQSPRKDWQIGKQDWPCPMTGKRLPRVQNGRVAGR